MRRRAALAIALFALPAVARAQTATVSAEHAWARATAPSAMTGGAFLTLSTTAPDAVVSASSPVAGMVELHQTVAENGVMKMLPVPALKLAPGSPVELKPGGYHIMLMHLKTQLKQGNTFPLTLTFEHAPPVTVQVMIEAPGASGPMHPM